MAIQPYINFQGECLDAVTFYAKAFGAELQKVMTFGDIPPSPDFQISEEAKKLVMHTFLYIEGTRVMFSDAPPWIKLDKGNNISLTVVLDDEEKIRKIFGKLREGGQVTMELGETFWSPLYGFVTDKFGIGWQLNLEKS